MSARIRTNKPVTTGETRRNIILPESFDVEIDIISDFLRASVPKAACRRLSGTL